MKQRVRPEPVEEAREGLSMVTGEEIWTSQGQNESTMGGAWWLEMQIVGSPYEKQVQEQEWALNMNSTTCA